MSVKGPIGDISGSPEIPHQQGKVPAAASQNTIPETGRTVGTKKEPSAPTWSERVQTGAKMVLSGLGVVGFGALAVGLLPFTAIGLASRAREKKITDKEIAAIKDQRQSWVDEVQKSFNRIESDTTLTSRQKKNTEALLEKGFAIIDDTLSVDKAEAEKKGKEKQKLGFCLAISFLAASECCKNIKKNLDSM